MKKVNDISKLNELSKFWYNRPCKVAAGELKFRIVCTFEGQDDHYEVMDDYCEHIRAASPVYEYEHLSRVKFDDSGLMFVYTDWGAVYRLEEKKMLSENVDEQCLDINYIIDNKIGFSSNEEVVIASTIPNNQIAIFSKSTPGWVSAVYGREDILRVRIYDKNNQGKVLEQKYRLISRNETVLSSIITSDFQKVLINTDKQTYVYDFQKSNWEYYTKKVPPIINSNRIVSKLTKFYNPLFLGTVINALLENKMGDSISNRKSVAFSKDRLTKMEVSNAGKDSDYICLLANYNNNYSAVLKSDYGKDGDKDVFKNKVMISDNGRIGLVPISKLISEVWDLNVLEPVRKVVGSFFLLSHNGEVLISIEENIICLWDVATGKLVKELKHDQLRRIDSMDISNDGKSIIACGGNCVCLWKIN